MQIETTTNTLRDELAHKERACDILQEQNKALADALHELWKLIEGGALVRDISHDDEPGWTLRAIPIVAALKHTDTALRAAGRLL